MNPSSEFYNVPFQLWIFAIATLLNVLSDRFGVIGWTISACIHSFAKEIAALKTPATAVTQTLEQITQQVIAELRADLGADRPVGRIVGMVERELYFYALIYPMHGMITAVLLFKAFSGWLKLGDPPPTTAPTNVLGSQELKGLQTLARYYSYAIGNFLSLAWALLIFEVIRAAMWYLPHQAAWLVITKP
jgi:hypothetical protein